MKFSNQSWMGYQDILCWFLPLLNQMPTDGKSWGNQYNIFCEFEVKNKISSNNQCFSFFILFYLVLQITLDSGEGSFSKKIFGESVFIFFFFAKSCWWRSLILEKLDFVKLELIFEKDIRYHIYYCRTSKANAAPFWNVI